MSDLTTNTYIVTDEEVREHGLQGVVGDRLNMTPDQAKLRFDELPDLIRKKLNRSLTRIDSFVAETDSQRKEYIDSLARELEERLKSIESRITAEGFVASINGSSMFDIDTSGAYEDILSGTVAIAEVIGQLGANTNSIKSSLESLNEIVEAIKSSVPKLSDYGDGSQFGDSIDNFITAGTFLTSAMLSNLPDGLLGRKVWITVKKDTPTSDVIYQEIQNAEEFVDGSSTYQVGNWYRVSTDGGKTWSKWTPSGAIQHSIYGGTNLNNASYIRIGEILICMGYVSIKPTAKNKQYNKKISFPVPFLNEPHIQLSFGWSPETLAVISAQDATARDFVISLYSSTTAERRVRWFAIGKVVI